MRQACLRMLALLAIFGIGPTASAAPCVGFNDVDDTNPPTASFCDNVEWIKNRSVTLGCNQAGTLYCPFDPVNRLAMAAFLNRLGTALTPVELRVDTTTGAIDLDASPVVCQTSDYTVALNSFPRRAYVDLSFGATSPTALDFAADLMISVNNGANWSSLTTTTNRGHVPANQWGNLSNVAATDLIVGQSVRFGVRASRDGLPGTADLAAGRCQLRALIYSRDGTTSPF